jgi:pimeloyl-ACP methyl ester carboxylesterase
MPVANVDGLEIAYDVVGDGDETWVITPGGRYSKDYPGIRETAEALAATGRRVLLWDRPNCGESGIRFAGPSENVMNGDALAGLVRTLGLAPVVVTGGSAGSRGAVAAAALHPEIASGLVLWLLSGGVYASFSLANYYCGDSLFAAWFGGMEAVAELPVWAEVLERNPANRERMLALDRDEFIATMERWMLAYPPNPEQLVPGVPNAALEALSVPTLVFRSSATDLIHARAASERFAALVPGAQLVEPPWDDQGWLDLFQGSQAGESWCRFWPDLVPQLAEWADAS